MSDTQYKCQGQFDYLSNSSYKIHFSSLSKPFQKIRRFTKWHLENMGLKGTLRYAMLTITKNIQSKTTLADCTDLGNKLNNEDVLNLKSGELVEVKSIDEIMATLDTKRRNKGLFWMNGMKKYCGNRFKVLRRVEKIMLESNGKLRNMKNTVLLDGVMCDGKAFGNCDRCCFHFWREVWLKRISQQ
jgi:hypothetical protein